MDEDDLKKFRKKTKEALAEGTSKKTSAAKRPKGTKTSAASGNERYQEFRGRRGGEMDLWVQWKNEGRRPDHLEKLLGSLEPMIDSEARKRASGTAGTVPLATIKAHLREAAIQGIGDYDPSRASLSTHLHNKFRAVSGVVAAQRNIRHMPKAYTDRYQDFQNARSQFENDQGRPPTTDELKAHLPGWSVKLIKQMDRGFGQEAFTDFGSGELRNDPGSEYDAHRGAIQYMRASLNEDEKRFADLYFPASGERPGSMKTIASRMGVPLHKAYKIKSSLETKIAPAVKGR